MTNISTLPAIILKNHLRTGKIHGSGTCLLVNNDDFSLSLIFASS